MLPFEQLSYWEKETYLNNIDYLIIGSGIVGLSTAIHLKQAEPDKKVVVLERGYLPTGGSTKNAGFACLGSPSELIGDIENAKARTKIEDRRSEESSSSSIIDPVWNTYKKRFDGLNYLRQMLGDEAIGYTQAGACEIFKESNKQMFKECLEALEQLNEKVELITGVKDNFQEDHSILKASGMKGFCGAISIKAEGMIDTGKMMESLIRKAIGLGVIVLNGISVLKVELNSDVRLSQSLRAESRSEASSSPEARSEKCHPEIVEGREAKYSRIEGLKDSGIVIETNYGSISASKIAICTNGLASFLLSLREPQAPNSNPANGRIKLASQNNSAWNEMKA